MASAAVKCGPMVMLSLLIQGIFAEELITRHLPVLAGSQVVADGFVDKICLVPVKLQVSAVLIFTTLMVHNTPQVCVW